MFAYEFLMELELIMTELLLLKFRYFWQPFSLEGMTFV